MCAHGSFGRIHRNTLVNVDHVRKMSALSSQRWIITMSNDKEFIVSKRQAAACATYSVGSAQPEHRTRFNHALRHPPTP
jgi:DNA-binding LytR/AlgR family response regulator